VIETIVFVGRPNPLLHLVKRYYRSLTRSCLSHSLLLSLVQNGIVSSSSKEEEGGERSASGTLKRSGSRNSSGKKEVPSGVV
jgi:hypothetical protein